MRHVLIVGGGLAGLSAAVSLAQRRVRVTILEGRSRLGGRAGSFVDPINGQMIDACQHVSMGCCTAFTQFCRTVGIRHMLAPQPVLHFMTPDRRVSRFVADPWPAPFHLGRALLGAHYLTLTEKLRVIHGLIALLRQPADSDEPLADFLHRHFQTARTISRFWGVVLVSALNETVDRAGTKYARKVFLDGFIRDRTGHLIEVPTVPLDRLYSAELSDRLIRQGVVVRLNTRVKQVRMNAGRVAGVILRDGSTADSDAIVLAVPFGRVAELLPPEVAATEPFSNCARLTASPITSVHLWFDRQTVLLPHVVLVDGLGQWLFNRGEIAPGEHYLQVVISAARSLQGLDRDEVRSRVLAELCHRFPAIRTATLLRAMVITDHAATFSAVPGVDRFRPPQRTPIPNLVLAGDWTRTGWPATMEGAVRSGKLAADALAPV